MTTCFTSRALRRDDGAIMTEAAIVLPFFILLWMGLVALHSLWTARLTAQTQAHGTAYEGTARGQCEGNANEGPSDANAATEALDSNTTEVLKAGGNDLFDWSPYVIVSTVMARHIPRPLGGPEKGVSGKSRILCNTKPQSHLGDFIFDMIASWVP